MSPIDNVANNRSLVGRPAANGKPAAARTAGAVKGPAIARDELRTAGRPVQPTRTRLSATEQMKADRPKFKNPDEYKNYVIKFKGYHEAAKNELAVARQALEAEKARLSEADAELGKPLKAAQRVLADTHKLYQDPIDRISGDLRGANDALQDAIYPGRRKAAELDGEASRLANSISRLEGDISSARSRIGSLETSISHAMSRRSSAYTEKSEAESRIRSLEPQAPSSSELSNQRARVNDAASRLREAESRVSSANAALSKKRSLESEISNLTSARDSVRSAESELSSAKSSASGYKGYVTRAEHELEAAMGLPESDASKAQKVTAARSKVAEAQSKYSSAASRVQELEGRIARYGSVSSIDSQLSSARSQLSQYAGAEGEYSSATSAKGSAQSSYDNAKRRYDDMANIAEDLDRNHSKLNNAISTINQSNATIASSTAEKEQKNREIYQLQEQLDTQVSQRNHIVAEANKERARQNPADHPQVKAAKTRVDNLQGELKQAQDLYNQKIAGPKAKVDDEQKIFNEKMKPFREKVTDAERQVGVASKAIEEVAVEFEKLRDSVGFFKRIWWKLFHHFDVKDFWKEQGNLVAAAIGVKPTTQFA